jgi:hypothetical protein
MKNASVVDWSSRCKCSSRFTKARSLAFVVLVQIRTLYTLVEMLENSADQMRIEA